MFKDLDEKIYDKIVIQCEQADELLGDNNCLGAIELYQKALSLIPNSKYDYETSTWIFTALGDSYFLIGDYKNADLYFSEALKCPNAYSNPFIHLRSGQSFYELGELELAKEHLISAYILEGNEIFKNEDEKFFSFIANDIEKEDVFHVDNNIEKSCENDVCDNDIDKIIETLSDKANIEFEKANYLESVQYRKEAWNLLPEPKFDHPESYWIIYFICDTYLLTNEKHRAREWVDKIFECCLDRIDDGDREFLKAKVSYELGDVELAKKYFKLANKKSKGRCFIDEAKKYLECID